jgi:hypothetical protein
MSKPENPAERSAETRTDDKKHSAKDAQLEGNRRPDKDLPRGAEGDTRRASGMQR